MTALKDYIAQAVVADGKKARTEKIQLRLTPYSKARLEKLSSLLGVKPTPCAQDILEAAVEDALSAAGQKGST
jgi:hypothetical protein